MAALCWRDRRLRLLVRVFVDLEKLLVEMQRRLAEVVGVEVRDFVGEYVLEGVDADGMLVLYSGLG